MRITHWTEIVIVTGGMSISGSVQSQFNPAYEALSNSPLAQMEGARTTRFLNLPVAIGALADALVSTWTTGDGGPSERTVCDVGFVRARRRRRSATGANSNRVAESGNHTPIPAVFSPEARAGAAVLVFSTVQSMCVSSRPLAHRCADPCRAVWYLKFKQVLYPTRFEHPLMCTAAVETLKWRTREIRFSLVSAACLSSFALLGRQR